jgi:steroid delta-isomerase-like uncharacterized protein
LGFGKAESKLVNRSCTLFFTSSKIGVYIYKGGQMKKLFLIIPLALILCFIVDCQKEEAMTALKKFKTQAEIEKQNKEIIIRWATEVNKENFEQLFSELWADDCINYLNSNPEPIDYEQFKKILKNFYSNFPVITHEIHDIIAKGDKVIARFTARTTHDVDSYGIPATGRELEWTAIAIFQISDGKIQTRWEVADILSMYEQLGMELQITESKK